MAVFVDSGLSYCPLTFTIQSTISRLVRRIFFEMNNIPSTQKIICILIPEGQIVFNLQKYVLNNCIFFPPSQLVTPVRHIPAGFGPKLSLNALKVPHRLSFQYPCSSSLRTTSLQQLCPQEAMSPHANLPCLLYNTLFKRENTG